MKTNKVNVAIVINLSGQVLSDCMNIMQYFNENHSMNFILNSQEIPHIGLSVGEVDRDTLELIFDKIDFTFKDVSPFLIKTNGIGIFLSDTINIHLRWVKNNDTIRYKQEVEHALEKLWSKSLDYNSANTWLPRTSLLYKDITYSNLSEINFNKLNIQHRTMLVKSVSILQIEKNKKEKEIKKIILKGKINE